MTMTGEPTLGEVARTLERIEIELNRRLADFSSALSMMITRDLYEAHRQAMKDDITEAHEDIADLRKQLEIERERKAADRRVLVGAVIAAALSLAGTVIGTALILGLGLKGT